MKNATIMKGAVIACCLIGMLVLPVAAAPAGQGNTTIDPGLINDLWSAQEQHRLAVFDANVAHANNVIGILDKYNIDTAAMQATLSQISGQRPALESAFTNQDRTGLKSVNQQLQTLWKQFRQDAKTAVRDHYKAAAKTRTSSAGGATAFTNADAGALAL